MKENKGKKTTVIRDELNLKEGGLYCYMPFENIDKHKKAVFKIGLAINFNHRLESYHTYFPLGVYMVAFLESPPLPRNLRGKPAITKKKHYLEIEKFIFDYVNKHDGKRIFSTTRVKNMNINKEGETEWTYTNENVIHEAFDAAHTKYGGTLHAFFLKDINKKAKENEDDKPNYIAKIVFHT